MSKIEVLIATMERENFEFLKKMNLSTDAVIVNQNSRRNHKESFKLNSQRIKFIHSLDRGLSNSRNLALENASADICVIADDDVIYDEDYEEKIQKAYEQHPEADIIAFQVKRTGNSERKKTFSQKKSKVNYLSSMKISSVEITFRREKIIENNLSFNPHLGAGTEFYNGEESVFLYQALKKGLKIVYLPVNIAEVETSGSSWFEGYTEKYFHTTGAKFYNMSRRYYPALIWQFAVRKRRVYEDSYSVKEAVKLMFEGAKKYKEKYRTDRKGQKQ